MSRISNGGSTLISSSCKRLTMSLGMAIVSVAVLHGQASVLTWHNDSARTGQNLQETILTTANVKSSTFGRLSTISVDGKVDAQPLYVPALTIPLQGVHNVLFVATEHDSLYAFDADTFGQLLNVSLLAANETSSDDRGCSNITPEIGITATPAIDLGVGPHGTIYVISMSKDSSAQYHQRLHALDLTTFAEQFSGPVEILATSPGSGAENTFVPEQHKERSGLLISGGLVYTTWASHCDNGDYAGWVLSYNETSLAQVGVLNLEPNGKDGGIWSAGSGPAADGNGNLYLLTGNGTFDTTLASGFPSLGDYGNAFVKVSTAGPLSVTDYFTMTNTLSESGGDVDLGAGGLLLLPPLNNTQGQPVSLVVGAGKDTNIYVVSQNNLGGFSPSMDSIYQLMSNALPSGTWSSPAWFNGNLYYGGVNDSLKAFTFVGGSFSLASYSSNTFGFPGTTPSVSANGTSNGIVWAVDNLGIAVLHAYGASNLATELYNSNQAGTRDNFGGGNKFIAPTIANGRVYVGTTSGVGVFGLLAGNSTAALSITKTHDGNFTQGQQSATYSVTVSNTAGAAQTTGTVAITDTIPTGLTLVAMSGPGWSCMNNVCSRGDALPAGSSYPAVTVMVSVLSNAPSRVMNSVTVAGGGDTSSNNKTANDTTTINPLLLTLTVNVSPSTGGTATPASGATFAQGSVVNLEATPNPGYLFINWTGNVTNANNASTTITMNSAQTVTANFAAGPTSLGGTNTGKSGPVNGRIWAFSITNNGLGAALNVVMSSFTLTQVFGAACTPTIGTLFPLNLGDLAPAASAPATVTVDFTSCPISARFTLNIGLSANAGQATGSIIRGNQFQ
jgi:uncharacterized repeat protein (TIGR01451 family)